MLGVIKAKSVVGTGSFLVTYNEEQGNEDRAYFNTLEEARAFAQAHAPANVWE